MKKNWLYPIPFVILLAVVLGCGLFSKSGESEVVVAATEVGTPQGEKVSKQIGPSGGTLASPDGRMTLTVPEGVLTETVAFSMQPISNMAVNGLGLAYRLEPDGMTFSKPLGITFRYDENDLEGTVAEALSLAYQDKSGAWHLQNAVTLDHAARTATISTTHFTDFAMLPNTIINPIKATVKVGDRAVISVQECEKQGFWDRIRSKPVSCSSQKNATIQFNLRGQGTLSPLPSNPAVTVYIAPAKKPNPNVAYVVANVKFEMWDEESGRVDTVERSFATKITIVDAGYRVTGTVSDVKFSGKVCDFTKPFKVLGISSFMSYNMFLSPSSESAGVITFDESAPMLKASGNGRYTVEQPASGNGKLKITMNSIGVTPYGSRSGGGTIDLALVPLEPNEECKINEQGLQVE